MKTDDAGIRKRGERASSVQPHIHIIGDNHLLNGLMAAYLSDHAPFRCMVAEKPFNGQGFQNKNLKGNLPELLLIDWNRRDRGKLIRAVISRDGFLDQTRPRVALFNAPEDDAAAEKAITEGVAGIFPPKTPPDTLIRGIDKILGGELWYPRHVLSHYLMRGGANGKLAGPVSKLTPRERQILAEIASGRSNRAIAESLGLRLNTVKSHIYKIYRKINVPNRLQAALWAARYL